HDDIVIFESTVYPGATEEECVPILEKNSGLTLNTGFYVGYSSERVNPGDDTHSLTNIVKVTSGSSEDSALLIDKLYSSIISAGTHLASSIKVAEAAKVIENTQRDLNIALVNELSILFEKLEIDTQDVLKAAGSKWNFLPFSPGLVGGHCIGVDPYYLTYKAQQVGHHPDVILAGRRINDSMGDYVAERVVRLMLSKRIHVIDARILIMGFAFKENCPDTRNSRVKDIINTLQSYQTEVDVYDPWVDRQESELLIESLKPSTYDAIIIAVAHDQIREMGIDTIKQLGKVNSAVFDVKHVFSSQSVDGSL
ncbi:MAG: nucleotide sugar dehydrogenase, partial [Gammaproteobacteria bacterium]|nr:nucleotide sugar dehydrogenase [Gammaproteobacteria bacterium]